MIRLPHIANFDDFDPLRAEAGVSVRYVQSPAELGRPHAVILHGTKSTLADLAWLRAEGFAEAICELATQGTAVVGICGGYQMLGRVIRDSSHVESPGGEAPGLGLLPVETHFETAKATFQVRARILGGPGWIGTAAGQEVEGYEIHMGLTNGGRPWLEVNRRNGGVRPSDRRRGQRGWPHLGLLSARALRQRRPAPRLAGEPVRLGSQT